MSDSMWSHIRQSTRLPRPGDSPGKNTGVGCQFLLQCVKVKNESELAQPRPTLCDPIDCSLPGSSIHGIFQARVLEWGAIAFSHYIPSTHLFCLYLLTSFIQFPLPSLPTSGNHKSDLFMSLFFLKYNTMLVSIIHYSGFIFLNLWK